MTTQDSFRDSLASDAPPPGIGPALEALWWVRHGDWARAHECVQAHEGEADCDRVHAHLHRQEGDLSNAGYWYRRAGTTMPAAPLDAEWQAIASDLLAARR